MIRLEFEQKSEDWFKARLGVITASCAYDLLPSKKGGGFKEARNTYMNQLVGEVCTGFSNEIDAQSLAWGNGNEEALIAAFEFEHGSELEQIGFVYKDELKRCGASPDFMIKGSNIGGEGKCPINPGHHIAFILDDKIKPEYIAQVQYSLWVTGFDQWFFASFQPRMKTKILHYKVIDRDQEFMRQFDELVPEFILEMDKKLATIGISFGDQWRINEPGGIIS